MIANENPSTPGVGIPDASFLEVDAFHNAIVSFIERELPVWRDRSDRPLVTDEPRLNETLCDHLDWAARHSFDSIRFCHEPYQSPGRAADLAVKPGKRIIVEAVEYSVFEQLLPIECKRLPTPKDNRRSDCEYVHGMPGHRTGAIERFKHALHGPLNKRALIIAFVQSESCNHWLSVINERINKLAIDGVDEKLWSPQEQLSADDSSRDSFYKMKSNHRRIQSRSPHSFVEIEHLWLQMN